MEKVNRGHLAGLELFARLHDSDLDYMISEDLGNLIAQASAAPEQEPVAWGFPDPEPAGRPFLLLVHTPDAVARPEELFPLYTHADPSEVERLRAEIESMRERVTPTHKSLIGKHAEIIKERDLLREKLADAQALLRDCHAEFDIAEASGFEVEMRKKIAAFLSATAQPAEHESDCSTNNRGVPELLGPCDCKGGAQ